MSTKTTARSPHRQKPARKKRSKAARRAWPSEIPETSGGFPRATTRPLPRDPSPRKIAAARRELSKLREFAQLYAARGYHGWDVALGHVDAALDELRKVR